MSKYKTVARNRTEVGFSLLELLLVISIITLLSAVVVPGVKGVVSANRLSAAGQQVASLVATARQEAMASNTLTALVLLLNQGIEDDGRCFTVLKHDRKLGWVQSKPWAVLPEGIIVDIGNSEACSFILGSPDPFPFLKDGQASPPIAYRGVQVRSSGGYAARIFLPGGGLSTQDTPTHIRLVEGHLKEGSIVYAQGEGAPNYCDITIIGATGQTRIDRP